MTFDPTIPGPNDLLSDSQGDIRTNFNISNNSFAVDHVAFNVGVDPGRHKQIYFNTNNVPGAPAGTQSVIYTNGATPVPYHVNSALTSEIGRIWARVYFNGAAVPAFPGVLVPAAIENYNVATINRVFGEPAGAYTITFTAPLPNASYLAICSGAAGGGTSNSFVGVSDNPGSRNVAFLNIKVKGASTGLVDNQDINILIIGN